MKLSEKERNFAFALLAVLAVAAAAYVLFFSSPPDAPAADARQFYNLIVNSSSAGLLYDVRSLTPAQAQAIYQCGVNIISKGTFAGKTLQTVACDSSGCLSVQSGSNSSSKMTYEQAKSAMAAKPYVLIDGGQLSALNYFQRHLEITLGSGVTSENANCSIAVGSD